MKKTAKKSTKRIIAIFNDEKVIFDYTKVAERFGEGRETHLGGKWRIYGADRKRYDLETVIFVPGGVTNGCVELEYQGEDGKFHSLISDIILELDGNNIEAIFGYSHGLANCNIYDNVNMGEKF